LAAARRLIDRGENVDALDRHGQTALMLAAHAGHTELVRLLIDSGADLDRTAKYHLSALMLAVIGGHATIVELLLSAGCESEIQGSGAPGFAGKTASDLARDLGRGTISELLQSRAR